MGRRTAAPLLLFVALLAATRLSAADDEPEEPIEYHQGLPIVVLSVPPPFHSLTLVEGTESDEFAVRTNIPRRYGAKPFIATGDPTGLLFLPPDGVLFGEDGPRALPLRIRAVKAGTYTWGIKVNSEAPLAYREMAHLRVEVKERGQTLLSPGSFDSIFSGARSRRYTVTLPGDYDADLVPSVGLSGTAGNEDESLGVGVGGGGGGEDLSLNSTSSGHSSPLGIRFEPPVLKFRGSVRSAHFTIVVDPSHDLQAVPPEALLEEDDEGRVLGAAYMVSFRFVCPHLPPSPPPQPDSPPAAPSSPDIDLSFAPPTPSPTPDTPPVRQCDALTSLLPPRSLEVIVRAPLHITIQKEVFLPLDEWRTVEVSLSRPEDVVVSIRAPASVLLNTTDLKFSRKSGIAAQRLRLQVRPPQPPAGSSSSSSSSNCSMAEPCSYTLSYVARYPDDSATGQRGGRLAEDSITYHYFEDGEGTLDAALNESTAAKANASEPGFGRDKDGRPLPYNPLGAPVNAGATSIRAFGKGLDLIVPGNDTISFVNQSTSFVVAVPESAWRVWGRVYGRRGAAGVGAEEAAAGPEPGSLSCALIVEIDVELEQAREAFSDPDPASASDPPPDPLGESDTGGIESDSAPPLDAPGPRPLPPGVEVLPRSLCFHPALGEGNKREFRVLTSRPGMLNLTYRLTGPGASFFRAAAAGPTLALAHLPLLDPDFDLSSRLELGGLHEEIRQVIRRAFLTRILPKQAARGLGLNHVRGILLYGPPGCGKTTLARQIGRLLGAAEPQVVSGPEIVNKFLGESESRLRSIFLEAEARAATGDPRVQLIIFDEIDAMFRSRGRGGGGAADLTYDGLTNTLLSKMDGVTSVPNVLVIGTTNRKDLLEPALLRPGRMDVQIELALPDEGDRADILRVHLRRLVAQGRVASDVDPSVIATWTESYTGAEIEGLVRSATSHALERALKDALAVRRLVPAGEGGEAMDIGGRGAFGLGLGMGGGILRVTDAPPPPSPTTLTPNSSATGSDGKEEDVGQGLGPVELGEGSPAPDLLLREEGSSQPPSSSTSTSRTPFSGFSAESFSLNASSIQVTLSDFEAALLEVEPSHRDADEKLSRLAPPRVVKFTPGVDHLLNLARSLVARVRGLPRGYHLLLEEALNNATAAGVGAGSPLEAGGGAGRGSGSIGAVTSRLKRQMLRLKREGKWKPLGTPGPSLKTNDDGHASNSIRAPHPLEASNVLRVLIHGRPGSGKTALAAWVARECSAFFDTLEVIAPAEAGDAATAGIGPLDLLRRALESARKERFSLILLDDIDGGVEYIEGVQAQGSRNRFAASGPVATLRSLLRQRVPSRNRLLLIATASTGLAGTFPQLTESFDVVLEAPMVATREDLDAVVTELGGPGFRPLSDAKAVSAVSVALAPDLPLPIRRLLTILDVLHRTDPEHTGPRDGILEMLGYSAPGEKEKEKAKEAGAGGIAKEKGGKAKGGAGGAAADPYASLRRRVREASRLTRVVEFPSPNEDADGTGVNREEEEGPGAGGTGRGPRNTTVLHKWW